MASLPPSPTIQPQGNVLPHVSAMQASVLLRSAAAIATELAGNAFGPISKAVFDELSTRVDFEPPVIMTRRAINDQLLKLRNGFLQSLKARQDESLQVLLAVSGYGGGAKVAGEQMSLVEVDALSNRKIGRASCRERV